MTARTEMDIEHRLNAVRMTESERVAALSALRKGIMIVEAAAWLAHQITHLCESVLSRPRLAR
jgi:hypothetical protein